MPTNVVTKQIIDEVAFVEQEWPLRTKQLIDEVAYAADFIQTMQIVDEVAFVESEWAIVTKQIVDEVAYLEGQPPIPLPFGDSEEAGHVPTLTPKLSLPFGPTEEAGDPPGLHGYIFLPFGPSEESGHAPTLIVAGFPLPFGGTEEQGFVPVLFAPVIRLPFGGSEEQGFPPAGRRQAFFLPFGPTEEQGWPPQLHPTWGGYFDTLRDFHYPLVPGHTLPDWDTPSWSGMTASPIVLKVYTDNPVTGAPTVIPMPLFGKPIRWEIAFTGAGSLALTLSLPGLFDLDGDRIVNSDAFAGRLVLTVQKSDPSSTLVLTLWTQNAAGLAVPLKQSVLTEAFTSVLQEGFFYKGLALTLDSDRAESLVCVGVIQ